MKNTSFVTILLMMFIVSHAQAWEMPQNPDRFPSLGLNVTTARLTGEKTYASGPADLPQMSSADNGILDEASIGADVRFPITNAITLLFGYDHINQSGDFVRTGNILKEGDSFSGYRLSFGTRVYFNR